MTSLAVVDVSHAVLWTVKEAQHTAHNDTCTSWPLSNTELGDMDMECHSADSDNVQDGGGNCIDGGRE